MRHREPEWGPEQTNRAEVAAGVGLAEADLLPGAPIQSGSTGTRFLFVPLRDRATVDRALLDVPKILKALGDQPLVGIFVFAPDADPAAGRVHSRMFAQHTSGIPEDPATGSASGPLGAYLVRHRLVNASGRVAMVSDQGVKMGRHSHVHIRGVARDGHLDEIEVGGSVVPGHRGTPAGPVTSRVPCRRSHSCPSPESGGRAMKIGRLVTLLLLLPLTLAVGGGSATAQPAGTLVVGLVAEPVNLDPAQVTDFNSNRVGRRIVEPLVTFAEETTQLVPGLAESWTISPDGLQYTFKLRKGVKFHDGTPFNAAAAKFSIERQINPEHPANKLGKYPFANYFFGNVKAVEAMDDSTVRFVLKEPRASFLVVMAAAAASMVSPTAALKAGVDFALAPVGTGPFRYGSWARGQSVVLEKFPDYWKGASSSIGWSTGPSWRTRPGSPSSSPARSTSSWACLPTSWPSSSRAPRRTSSSRWARMSGTSASTTPRSRWTTSACARRSTTR